MLSDLLPHYISFNSCALIGQFSWPYFTVRLTSLFESRDNKYLTGLFFFCLCLFFPLSLFFPFRFLGHTF